MLFIKQACVSFVWQGEPGPPGKAGEVGFPGSLVNSPLSFILFSQ